MPATHCQLCSMQSHPYINLQWLFFEGFLAGLYTLRPVSPKRIVLLIIRLTMAMRLGTCLRVLADRRSQVMTCTEEGISGHTWSRSANRLSASQGAGASQWQHEAVIACTRVQETLHRVRTQLLAVLWCAQMFRILKTV